MMLDAATKLALTDLLELNQEAVRVVTDAYRKLSISEATPKHVRQEVIVKALAKRQNEVDRLLQKKCGVQ